MMRWAKLAFDALRWADHLDEEGFYKNKRFFIQGTTLALTALTIFGLDIGATAEEKMAIAGGAMAIVGLLTDYATRKAGKKIDKLEEQLPEERKPRRAKRLR